MAVLRGAPAACPLLLPGSAAAEACKTALRLADLVPVAEVGLHT